MLVGELGYESISGSQSYSFKYSNEWLNRHASIILSEDIRNYSGVQYTQMIISVIMVSCLRRKDGHWLRHLT